MPKTVPESKFTELLGLDRISIIVHSMKCLWRELTKDDFGIDGEIEVLKLKEDGKGYEVTGGVIKVQAKSGSSYITGDKDDTFSVKSSKNDFELWYGANFPTLLIIYHPKEDNLYFKEMKSYLKTTSNVWLPPFRVNFSKSQDVFNSDALHNLYKYSQVSPPRISKTEKERLFSNLFKITKFPDKIWLAPSKIKSREEVWDQIEGSIPPFLLKDKKIITFSNLKNENTIFKDFCDISKTYFEKTYSYFDDDVRQRDFVNLLNQLIGKHIRSKRIKYNAEFKRNYFTRENEFDVEFKKRWLNIRTENISERTTTKFYKYGKDEFWRHLACNIKFRKLADSWYLQIIPMYFFTIDGDIPLDSEKVGPYTTRIKAQEMNQNVLNHVLFWIDAISGLKSKSKLLKIYQDDVAAPLLVIDKFPVRGITNFSIPYDLAVYEEPKRVVQTTLFALLNEDKDDYDETFEE